MSELDLELRARELVGETITEVCYQQLRWSDGALGDNHAVELAVHVRTKSGRRFRIGWGDELGMHHGHGITIAEVRRIDRDAGPLQRVRWPQRRIRASTLHWRSIREALRGNLSIMVGICGDHLRRTDYPHALQLDLDGGAQIFVCAAQLDGARAQGFANELLVVFSRAELERLGL